MMNMRLFFGELNDPRQAMKVRHSLLEIIAITIMAVAADCDSWDEMEDFGNQYEDWLREVVGLDLEYGIPTADTLERVWSKLDNKAFKKSFHAWADCIRKKEKGEIINLDGKTSKGSGDEEHSAIHMVSAWVSEEHLVIGQIAVPDKTNEITAVPELLEMLDISGCIITADAMSCQKSIAKEIIDKKADYVLGLKGNQGTLLEYAELLFRDIQKNPDLYDVTKTETIDKGHGRIEKRTYYRRNYLDYRRRKNGRD